MKVYFETYGCTMNQGDFEVMMGRVDKLHEIVPCVEECDVAVINSCGVIAYTENKILRRIANFKKLGKKVIVSGCLPRINYSRLMASCPDGVISARSSNLIDRALENVIKGRKFHNIANTYTEKSHVYKKRWSNIIAIVPIAEGCLGACSYCGTRSARGRLRSFLEDSILEEIEACVNDGYREIQLTAQDTGVYGVDNNTNLADLLNKIIKIPGKFKVRVGMMNPKFTLDILNELITSFNDEKVYKFLHVPLQSGDNEILKDMQRGYRVEDFEKIVKKFRKEFDITLSTDIIVGYPTEREASFLKSYKFIEKIRPNILNITRFSPRPGTRAWEIKDMPDRIKKERSRAFTKLVERIGKENNERFLNRGLQVLITETGKNSTFLGRSEEYKQVVLKGGRLGEFRKIKIRGVTSNYLIAG